MRVVCGCEAVEEADRGAHAAIGNFDGVHRGHQEVIARAGGPTGGCAVITFEPHPRSYFGRDSGPFRLTPPRTRERLLEEVGVETLFLLPFDSALADMPAETFAGKILGESLGLRSVTVGSDFRFGHRRTGDLSVLRRIGEEWGYEVREVQMAGESGEKYSSSAIRDALRVGRPEEAARQLGRWHCIEGEVQRGEGRGGRDLGMPTANIAPGETLQPALGVYAVQVEVLEGAGAGCYDGVASLGFNPTFDLGRLVLEAHLFGFAGSLYDQRVAVGLRALLREERKFDSLESLAEQMQRDAGVAKEIILKQPLPWMSSP